MELLLLSTEKNFLLKVILVVLLMYNEFVKRWRFILTAAAKREADVMISWAFGCGVYANLPEQGERVFKDAMKGFEHYFEAIEFPILMQIVIMYIINYIISLNGVCALEALI